MSKVNPHQLKVYEEGKTTQTQTNTLILSTVMTMTKTMSPFLMKRRNSPGLPCSNGLKNTPKRKKKVNLRRKTKKKKQKWNISKNIGQLGLSKN